MSCELHLAQNALHTFHRNFAVDEEVASLLSRCNVIWKTTRHNRLNGILPAPTLRTCTGKLV